MGAWRAGAPIGVEGGDEGAAEEQLLAAARQCGHPQQVPWLQVSHHLCTHDPMRRQQTSLSGRLATTTAEGELASTTWHERTVAATSDSTWALERSVARANAGQTASSACRAPVTASAQPSITAAWLGSGCSGPAPSARHKVTGGSHCADIHP